MFFSKGKHYESGLQPSLPFPLLLHLSGQFLFLNIITYGIAKSEKVENSAEVGIFAEVILLFLERGKWLLCIIAVKCMAAPCSVKQVVEYVC